MTHDNDYDALAARAEAGELRAISGTAKRAADDPDAGARALMLATGTDSLDDATSVALGRPRLDAPRGRSNLYWKVRPTAQLDAAAKSFAIEHDMNVSDLVRRGVAEYIENHSAAAAR